MKTLAIAALTLVLGLSACQSDLELGGGYRKVVDVPPEPIRNLDILFVVDSSGSMAIHQAELVESAKNSLFAQLDAELDGRPNLHVAVISTDVGAGASNISGCAGSGDDGRFRTEPHVAGCTPPDGAYIIDVDDGLGGRTTNYTGDIGDTFACVAQLGINGCGFEHPLEAMRRALDGRHPEHDGFLRDDALLLVVIVTDEDDCSASDNAVFDTTQDTADSPLGALSSFRCFEFGTVCDNDDPRVPGAKTNCVPRDNSPYLHSPQAYVTFLQGLKSDPSMVMVAGIFGDRDPVSVELSDNGHPQLADICGGGSGRVDPAPRLHAVLEQFPARYQFEPICNIAFDTSLSRIAHGTADVMSGSMCLSELPLDTDETTPGIQPRCRVFDVGADESAVPQCANDSDEDCFTLVTDEVECAQARTSVRVDVRRNGSRPPGTHLVVECVVAPAVNP